MVKTNNSKDLGARNSKSPNRITKVGSTKYEEGEH
jgi:hypothetical protein